MNQNIRICVLSYQSVHKKTIDTLVRLKINGYANVCVYAKPFHYRKNYTPQIQHRPLIEEMDALNTVGYEKIIQNIGYEVQNIDKWEEIDEKPFTIFLVCGAGIISSEVTKRYTVINAHPGYLPMVRGLDALKWAIMEEKVIGVTTHLLGDYVDAGYIIERRRVPIYDNDTFHTVAYRQYEMEIEMLVQAVKKVNMVAFFSDGENYPVHRRMPHELESKLYSAFERYKEMVKNHML